MEIKRAKAAILVEQKKPLIIDEIELPEKLECGQVLVKVYYSGICGSQIGEIDGVKGPDPFLPHLLGHEGSGEVVALHESVKHVKVGDHVVMHWRKGLGIEAAPPKYKWNGKVCNAGFVTTFNEYAVVSENRLTTIPKEFSLEIAPLFGCAVTTGLGVITNNAQVKIGQSVVVFGAGGIGLNIVQGAALAGAHPIIAVDLLDSRLEMARKFGATHCINNAKVDLRHELTKILDSQGADVAIDNTGNTTVIAIAYELTKPQGKTILVGVPKKGDTTSFYTLPLHFGKTLTGSHGGEAIPQIDIPNYIKLYDAKKLELDSLVTDRFSLEQINEAIGAMRDGRVAGRCLVKIS